MKKHAILACLLLISFWVNAQWQEITKYGKVTDFWYITENLQYIKADTSYIVENGIPRIIPEWGFGKSILGDNDVWNPADFVKGTLVGFKRIQLGPYSPKVDIYKTRDGGITWEKFAYKDYGDSAILPKLIAVDTQTVFLTGEYSDYQNNYPLPMIKVRKNKFEEVYSFGYYLHNSELIAITDTSTWYIWKYGPSGNKLYINKTKDGGKKWVMLDTNYFNNNNGIGKLQVLDEKNLLVYNIANISYSTDSGQSWYKIEKIYPSNHIVFLILSATIVGDKIFYIKSTTSDKDTQQFMLKSYDITSKLLDSITINKNARLIESTFDNKCFIFNTTFYQNINPIQHPLNVDKNETITKKTNQIYIYNFDDNLAIISKDKNTRNDMLCIYDYTGKLLWSEHLTISEGNNLVSISNKIIPGVYIVTLSNNSYQYTKKLVKF